MISSIMVELIEVCRNLQVKWKFPFLFNSEYVFTELWGKEEFFDSFKCYLNRKWNIYIYIRNILIRNFKVQECMKNA